MGKFHELRKLDVSKHVEKKNGLNYLSWAWAVDQLLQNDPAATWEYKEAARFGDTLMVFCSVTAFGKTMTAQLPVMDHRNKAIVNPDAFQVNVAMQRCLAKAIALHGIGLYIYAGEDLPESDGDQRQSEKKPAGKPADSEQSGDEEQGADIAKLLNEATTTAALAAVMNGLTQEERKPHMALFNQRMNELKKAK